MLDANFYFGCYWGDRRESAEQCAARILRLTCRLAGMGSSFASWKVVTSVREGEPLASDPTALAGVLEARNPDRGGSGYVLSLVSWQEGQAEGATAMFCCGGAGGARSVVNSVVLEPVYERDGLEIWMRNAKHIVEAVVEAFEPDWVAQVTPELRGAQPGQPRVPVVGAVTYLAGWRGEPPADLPAERMGSGWLFDLRREDVALPESGEALELRSILSGAGLLQPTPQVQP